MRITGRGLTAATVLSALILAGCGGSSDEVGEQTPAPAEATPSQVSADPSSPSAPAEPAASPSASESQAGPVEQDPELASLLAGLIIGDVPPVSLKATANVGADCGFDGGGCYLPDEKTIYLSDETTQFQRPELLAHEYLHYRWETEGLDDDAELAAALEKAFSDKEGLGSLVPSWQEEYLQPDGSVLPTELFSYSCTGQRPDQQEAIIAERCAEYLKVEALPVNQKLTTTALTDEIARQREEAGLPELELNPQAAAASEARAELFTPQSQVPLSEYPESVTEHLEAGCAPATYSAQLLRPYDLDDMVTHADELLKGALLSDGAKGVGVAIKEFDYIDARNLFGERTITVNATLVVTTVCT